MKCAKPIPSHKLIGHQLIGHKLILMLGGCTLLAFLSSAALAQVPQAKLPPPAPSLTDEKNSTADSASPSTVTSTNNSASNSASAVLLDGAGKPLATQGAVPSMPNAGSANTGSATAQAGGSKARSAEDIAAVNKVLERLRNDQSRISLDDIAAAEDALKRLEILNSIEKQLTEISKIRDAREQKSRPSFGGAGGLSGIPAVPASSLTPLPPPPAPSNPQSVSTNISPSFNSSANIAPTISPRRNPEGKVEIERISGAEGSLRATVSSGGERKNVGIGDSLADGQQIVSISADSVVLRNSKGKEQTVTLDKN